MLSLPSAIRQALRPDGASSPAAAPTAPSPGHPPAATAAATAAPAATAGWSAITASDILRAQACAMLQLHRRWVPRYLKDRALGWTGEAEDPAPPAAPPDAARAHPRYLRS